jgi:hypothetical protein
MEIEHTMPSYGTHQGCHLSLSSCMYDPRKDAPSYSINSHQRQDTTQSFVPPPANTRRSTGSATTNRLLGCRVASGGLPLVLRFYLRPIVALQDILTWFANITLWMDKDNPLVQLYHGRTLWASRLPAGSGTGKKGHGHVVSNVAISRNRNAQEYCTYTVDTRAL